MAVDPGGDDQPENPQTWNKYAYVRNNPLKYNDPDGKNPAIVIGAIAGGAIRAGVEVYREMHSEGKSFSDLNFQKVGAKALSGAIEGAIAGATAGLGLIGFVGANTAATVGAGILERGVDGDSSTGAPFDPEAMGQDAKAGAVGSLAGKAFQGIATGGDWKTVEIGTQGLGAAEKDYAQAAVKSGMSAGKVAVTSGMTGGGKKQPASSVDQKIKAMKDRAK